MFLIKKLALLVSLLVVGMLLLVACGSEEPRPAVGEQSVDTQAASDAEEPDAAGEPSSEMQVPTTRDEVPRLSAEELKERLDNGEEIVIGDTRSEAVFDVNHIAGAISTPGNKVLSQLEGVPLDQKIVLYCS